VGIYGFTTVSALGWNFSDEIGANAMPLRVAYFMASIRYQGLILLSSKKIPACFSAAG
jgi:hypothetical protein